MPHRQPLPSSPSLTPEGKSMHSLFLVEEPQHSQADLVEEPQTIQQSESIATIATEIESHHHHRLSITDSITRPPPIGRTTSFLRGMFPLFDRYRLQSSFPHFFFCLF
jgi:hypothetical protein